MSNLAEALLFITFPVFEGRYSGSFTEETRKVELVGESGERRHGANGNIGAYKHVLCLFHYYRLAVFRRRKTGIFLEKQAEILRTHVAAACDIGDLTFLVPVIGYDAYALYNAVICLLYTSDAADE